MANNQQPVSPIHFIDYSKISDTLMWFDNRRVLKFCVTLQRTDKYGNPTSFHREFSFINKSNNIEQISILRDYSYYFIIEDVKNRGFSSNNNIILKINDVELLKIFLNNKIIPWFGTTKYFGRDSNNRLIVKGAPKEQFPLNDKSYMNFQPTIVEYENTNEQKEGVRITINDINNFMDLPVDKFMEFKAIISNTDMLNAAMNMLNYVKVRPYGTNLMDLKNNGGNGTGGKKGFF